MGTAVQNIRKSLYSRISGVFLILLLFTGLASLVVWLLLWDRFIDYSEQYLNWNAAHEIEAELADVLHSPIDTTKVMGRLFRLNNLNPRFDIYLVDSEGNVVAWYDVIDRRKIDIAPLKEFIAATDAPRNSLYGENPKRRAGTSLDRVVFSAAPTMIGDVPGYVYVALRGNVMYHVYTSFGEKRLIKISFFWTSLMLSVIAIIGLVLFRLITHRFHNMTNTVEKFAQGDYAERVAVASEDEVGQLGKAFNTMADTIQNNIRALEHNDGLRRNLVANVSHDLRGPLTCIQGFLQMLILEHSERFEQAAVRYVEVIGKNVAHLRKLADALFELSKLEAKDATPALEAFPIEELAADIALKFSPQAQAIGVTVDVRTTGALPEVYADIVLIERVLSNLIDNSLRYTPSGGAISIELAPEGGRMHILIRDTGSGIPAEDLPFLFERFYRVEKHRSKKSGGSGLGLAIVKRILEAHGEMITVQSTVGEGTVFEFHLACNQVGKDKEDDTNALTH